MLVANRIRAAISATLLAATPAAAVDSAPVTAPLELARLAPGTLHSGIAALNDPTQTYELYLPSNFDAGRRWPLLYVFDPRSQGRAAAERFVPAAERWGWIVASSNNTLSDGPMEPNQRALDAMWPDLPRRLPIDVTRIYATGFSGCAILAWIVGLDSGQLAGVIAAGGRPPVGVDGKQPNFAVWAAAGREDFNFGPTRALDAIAARAGVPHRLEYFPGPHDWLPAEEASRAVAWLELVAMRRGSRAVDAGAVATLLADDLGAVDRLVAEGEALTAVRRLTALAETYRGLAEETAVAAMTARAAELDRGEAAARQRAEEVSALQFERAGLERTSTAARLLTFDKKAPSATRLLRILQLDELERVAGEPGARGDAGKRVRADARAQFAFYLPRNLRAAGEGERERVAFEVAVGMMPTNAVAWYNMACASARLGRKKDALAELARAVDLEPTAAAGMASDADFASLRDSPAFTALLARTAGH